MKSSDFNYRLPQSLIAQKPARPRDRSRLLVAAAGKGRFLHRQFYEIGKFLRPGDVLVLNDSKVIPARLAGEKPTGGKMEILLLKELKDGRWEALIKNLGTARIVKLGKSKLTARPIKNLGSGLWEIEFNPGGKKFKEIIQRIGQTPAPPYVKRLPNLKEYQTVFARHAGSAAAPTAGFHFTKRLLRDLEKNGIEILFITLHIGPGTFQPIKSENVKDHKIHPELAEISAGTARKINRAKKEGRRIIAVGTTVCRTLESFADSRGLVKAGRKEVDLFILPGYKFKAVNGLITNFHLPKTTLLLLVSAFLGFSAQGRSASGGKEKMARRGRNLLFRAYNEAIKNKFRFYSFGDAMMII